MVISSQDRQDGMVVPGYWENEQERDRPLHWMKYLLSSRRADSISIHFIHNARLLKITTGVREQSLHRKVLIRYGREQQMQ